MRLLHSLLLNKAEQNTLTTPLTFTNTGDNSATVKLTKKGTPTVDGIQYRLGTSGGWNTYTIDTELTLQNVGDVVQFQNTLETLGTNTGNYCQFVLSGQIAASGNLMSMLNYSDIVSQYAFLKLFYGCTSLVKAPKLPATTLYRYCYAYMFNGCTSLVKAPKLPATILADNCYAYMFNGCTSLKTAPELPATTLNQYCYAYMFNGCTSLVTAPELPATTLANNCYAYMFYGCSSLKTAPELPATTLVTRCYYNMFNSCSNLTKIKVSFSDWTVNTMTWVEGVASSGDFECPTELPLEYSSSNIPKGWTVNGVGNIVIENQKIFQSINDPVNFTPQYSLIPAGEVQFSIYSGSLPDGLTLNSDGSITGKASEPWEGQIVIEVTGNNYSTKTFTLSITLLSENAKITPNNLTSNTSNPDFVVSQRTTNGTYEAWKAMDGDISTYAKTKSQSAQFDWWQIDFLRPVSVTQVYFKCQNLFTAPTTYLEYSNDGVTFFKYDTTIIPATAEEIRTYKKGDPHRYYRFLCTIQNYSIQFDEIKFVYEPVEKYIDVPEVASKQAIVGNDFEYQIPYEKYPDDLEVTFEITEGTLPDGLIFDNTTGIIEGVANVAGDFNLTISMSTEGLESKSISLTLKVVEQGAIPTDAILYLDGTSASSAETGQLFTKNGSGEVISTEYSGYKVLLFQNGSVCLVSNEVDDQLPLNNADRCISLWAKPTNNTGQGLVSYGQNSANKAWQFALQSNCRLKIGGSNSASNEYVSPESASAGLAWDDWHHYLINKINGVEYLYIDNILVGSFNYGRSTASGNYVIGAGQDYHLTTGYRFSGYMTGIRMFNRSLNDTEILTLSQEYTF